MCLNIVVDVVTLYIVHHVVIGTILAERVGHAHDVGMVKPWQVNGFFLEFMAIVLRQAAVGHAGDTAIATARVDFFHKKLLDGYFLTEVDMLGKVSDAKGALSQHLLYSISSPM